MLHTDLIAPIPELLKRQAAARGSKVAYRDAQSSVTYAGLLDRTGKLAAHLADDGIVANDTVAIMMPNSVAVGRSVLCDHPCGRDRGADQLRRDRKRDRVSSDRRELQGGLYDCRARRPVREVESLGA